MTKTVKPKTPILSVLPGRKFYIPIKEVFHCMNAPGSKCPKPHTNLDEARAHNRILTLALA